MDFRGADPAGLDDLAAALGSRVPTLERSASEAHDVLRRSGRFAGADRVGTELSRRARMLVADAADLRRRADLIRDGERLASAGAVPPVLAADARLRAEFAVVAPMGLVDWGAAYAAWRDGPSVDALDRRDPAGVHAMLVSISRHAQLRLVLEAPEVIGRSDGAPVELRYLANRVLLGREIRRLESLHEAMMVDLAEHDGDRIHDYWDFGRREVLMDEVASVEEQLARYRLWVAEHRQVLLFDPSGDGRVAEVFGDLAGADHVAVVVPGITNEISNFGPTDGDGFRHNAGDLFAAASSLDDGVATIAWLGYDTPNGADAIVRSAAERGHDDLIRFVAGLGAAGDRHITVIGHSYGSLVTGLAAGSGIDADDIVFVGSPGTSLDHAGDANLPPGGAVWAGLAAWDPIGAGVSLVPSDPLEGSLSLPGRYLWDLITSGDLAAEDLWHGTNPAHESFGAVEFTTDGATGHSQYFDPGTESLENLARIVAGLTSEVTLVSPGPTELAPGPFGELELAPEHVPSVGLA